jgi:phospholipid-binding lipoprotein MlaA
MVAYEGVSLSMYSFRKFLTLMTLLMVCNLPVSFAMDDVNIDDISDDGMNEEFAEVDDRFEGLNRVVFGFNNIVDSILMKPLALTYETFVPAWGRGRIRSFLHNLQEPIFAVNHLLQGDVDKAFHNVGRFLTNTTVGVLGAFDVAGEASLAPARTDFGLTLKKYGIKTGPYIVLPLVGSSSMRDAPSLFVDVFMDPWQYHKFQSLRHSRRVSRSVTSIRYALMVIDKRQGINKLLEQLDAASLDKYVMLRSIYLQRR